MARERGGGKEAKEKKEEQMRDRKGSKRRDIWRKNERQRRAENDLARVNDG